MVLNKLWSIIRAKLKEIYANDIWKHKEDKCIDGDNKILLFSNKHPGGQIKKDPHTKIKQSSQSIFFYFLYT